MVSIEWLADPSPSSLLQAAVSRASILLRSQRSRKAAPAKKVRGRKNAVAAAPVEASA